MTTTRVYRLEVTWPEGSSRSWHQRRFLTRKGARGRAERLRQDGATVVIVPSEPIGWTDDEPTPEPARPAMAHEPIPGQLDLLDPDTWKDPMPELTPAQRRLLRELAGHDPEGPAPWLVNEPRQRFGLVVPTWGGTHGGELIYVYQWSVNGATLRPLHGAELIEYGNDQPVMWFRNCTGYHAVHRDDLTGCPIRATPAGHEAINPTTEEE